MRQKPCLTADDAERILHAARAFAVARQWRVTIAVVDDAGFLLRLERMDGASFQSPEVATMKAKTAALSRGPTKRMEDMVRERPGMLRFPDRLPIQGGLPLMHEGECVGGIGVSGVQSHEDEEIAAAGVAALSLSGP
jgi:glc operon protein GlcG